MALPRIGRVCYIQMAKASMEFDMQDHVANKYSLDFYERLYARVATSKLYGQLVLPYCPTEIMLWM